MNIKERLKKDKYYILVILIMLVIIIIMGINLIFKDNNNFINPYQVNYESNDNFLFLGDSITDFYPLDEYYDNLPVVNSGVAGNKTTDILNDMRNRVYQYNPTKVFLLIGTNDLDMLDDDIVNKTYKNIIKIINNIKENRDDATIYVESIYPVNSDIENSASNNRSNKNIKLLNSKLSSYCKDNNCTYINLYDKLTNEEGNLKDEYTTDGLHLSSLGYVVVTRELLPYLNE